MKTPKNFWFFQQKAIHLSIERDTKEEKVELLPDEDASSKAVKCAASDGQPA